MAGYPSSFHHVWQDISLKLSSKSIFKKFVHLALGVYHYLKCKYENCIFIRQHLTNYNSALHKVMNHSLRSRPKCDSNNLKGRSGGQFIQVLHHTFADHNYAIFRMCCAMMLWKADVVSIHVPLNGNYFFQNSLSRRLIYIFIYKSKRQKIVCNSQQRQYLFASDENSNKLKWARAKHVRSLFIHNSH